MQVKQDDNVPSRNRGRERKRDKLTPPATKTQERNSRNQKSERTKSLADGSSLPQRGMAQPKLKTAFGRAVRLLYWGTLLAQFIITSVSLTFLYCDSYFWPVTNIRGAINFGALLHLLVFCSFSALTQYNFLMAIFVGPGYVPQSWKPEKEEHQAMLQYCVNCEGFKAPRAHHCRSCGRCVEKMEHHCPWINNCVGHRNHAYFLRFLFFATMGCLQAVVVLLIVVLKVLNFVFTDFYYNQRSSGSSPKAKFSFWARLFNFQPPPIFFTFSGILWIVMMIGFALGVVLAVGALFVIQLRIILRNETSIESWILNKASYYLKEEQALENGSEKATKKAEKFENPYHLGWRENAKQVFFNRTYNPQGDGLWWPVRPGFDQFSLTKEQIRQKQFKQDASVDFLIERPYTGSLFPLFSQGVRVCLSFPWTIDEARLKLVPGDVVTVTRFQKHWLYGSKRSRATVAETVNGLAACDEKGWFPRRVSKKFAPRKTE